MSWKICQGANFIWRQWEEDEILVYDTVSGDTHLVNRVTAEVLRALERCQMDSSGLCDVVASSMGLDNRRELEPYISKLLAYLDEIGLVEPVS